jgi:chemotaxis protein methyltransferase CheR
MEKLVNDNNCSISEITKKIKTNPTYLEKIVRDITVNTTELFRDPKVWHEIQKEIIPKFKTMDNLRIWHAGCSSGQELYSMMMLLNEYGLLEKSKIVGSDLNTEMLDEAAKGNYKYRFNSEYLPNFDQVLNTDAAKDKIPYTKYMDIDQSRDILRMKTFLTNKPVFYKHDLVCDKNIFNSEFDLIMCRNVLIYFNNNLQNKVFEMFWDILAPNGVLIIGLHESIMGPAAVKFIKKGQLYYKKFPAI